MNSEPVAVIHQPGRWDPVFSALYEPMIQLGERLGMREQRRRLLARARGRTLEIGGGTGLNIPLYPEGLEELILTEPYEPMRRRLERRLSGSGLSARTIDASAESIPIPDGSLDTVVSTLVLCTVDDPARSLAEIARVLRPDGQLLFLEHVRSHSPRLAGWQDRMEVPWRHFAAGCRCNRDTIAEIARAGFEDKHEEVRWRGVPPFVAPVVAGRAWIGMSGRAGG
jgi:ubiquinone/menaquinone biosynthesis C-methylase UbiE